MDEPEPAPIASFSKHMRKATREVHSISDALVNAKLVFALSDNCVWLDGLVVFWPIFKWLEHNAPEHMLPAVYHRNTAFEDDIRYYSDLQDINVDDDVRPAVRDYLDHLGAVKAEDPRLLWAYVYHLYMGLLSGGQILQSKRRLAAKFKRTEVPDTSLGYHTTSFDEKVGVLKQRMRKMMDEAALEFDDELKERMIEESKKVFEMNNKIVNSVEGVRRANIKSAFVVISVVVVAILILKWIRQ